VVSFEGIVEEDYEFGFRFQFVANSVERGEIVGRHGRDVMRPDKSRRAAGGDTRAGDQFEARLQRAGIAIGNDPAAADRCGTRTCRNGTYISSRDYAEVAAAFDRRAADPNTGDSVLVFPHGSWSDGVDVRLVMAVVCADLKREERMLEREIGSENQNGPAIVEVA